MNATKILWGQVLLVSAVTLAFVWGATEWLAWRLAFQSQLGRPWSEFLGWPIYQPHAFFWWWFAYDAYARDIFVEGAYIAASGGIAAIIVAIAMSVWGAREAKRVTTYGSARWADTREVREAGLLGYDGALLGRWRDHYLRHDGPEHVLCFAPTRSGKGVGLVVPTLLTWSGSAIVHDIKGENWTLTAGWRTKFGRMLVFDPTNATSAAYNPLLEVRRGEWEVRDVQNIADVLVDSEGALERRNHWEKTSHLLLVGAILHVLYAEPDKALAGVANFLSDPRRPIETTLRGMMTTPHLGERGVHPVIATSACDRPGCATPTICGRPLGKLFLRRRLFGGCGHMSGLLMRGRSPLAMMLSASSGFSSAPRARSAGRGTECPGRRFAGSPSPHCALAKLLSRVWLLIPEEAAP